MDPYEELLRKLGFLHLKDDPDKLQETILRELGMSELRDDPAAMLKRGEEILKEKSEEFQAAREALGTIIQKQVLKRGN